MRVIISYDPDAREMPTQEPLDVYPDALEAVGFSFNPSGDAAVARIKVLSAALISEMLRLKEIKPAAGRHAAIAITDIETAQMRAVKAATWST